MSETKIPLEPYDVTFIVEAAKGFAKYEQSIRDRAIAAGVDDVELRVQKNMACLMRFARACSDELGANAYWLREREHDPGLYEPTDVDRQSARAFLTKAEVTP